MTDHVPVRWSRYVALRASVALMLVVVVGCSAEGVAPSAPQGTGDQPATPAPASPNPAGTEPAAGASSVVAPWGGPGARLARERLQSGSFAGRTWLSFVPAGNRRGSPLVVVLHGGGGTAEGTATDYPLGRWQRVAARHPGGIAVAYPDAGTNRSGRQEWNDCRTSAIDAVPGGGPDDVGFLVTLVNHMAATWGTSRDRVLVTGVSNGGMMALRMAAERPDVARAAGVVAASMPTGSCGTPRRPVPLVLVSGTADPLVPYSGGEVAARLAGDRGTVVGVDATLATWRRVGNGGSQVPAQQLPDLARRDGVGLRSSVAWRSSFPAGPGGSPVVLVRVDGGGHTVPDTEIDDPLPRLLVGPQNRDFNAVDLIWTDAGWP